MKQKFARLDIVLHCSCGRLKLVRETTQPLQGVAGVRVGDCARRAKKEVPPKGKAHIADAAHIELYDNEASLPGVPLTIKLLRSILAI